MVKVLTVSGALKLQDKIRIEKSKRGIENSVNITNQNWYWNLKKDLFEAVYEGKYWIYR